MVGFSWNFSLGESWIEVYLWTPLGAEAGTTLLFLPWVQRARPKPAYQPASLPLAPGPMFTALPATALQLGC